MTKILAQELERVAASPPISKYILKINNNKKKHFNLLFYRLEFNCKSQYNVKVTVIQT